DAGGAATSDGASARGGAGMNDEGRGLFSPCVNHVAVAGPLEETFGRERRRFFSGSAAFAATRATVAAAATVATPAATFATVLIAALTFEDFAAGGAATVLAAGLVVGFVAFAGAAPLAVTFGFGTGLFGA